MNRKYRKEAQRRAARDHSQHTQKYEEFGTRDRIFFHTKRPFKKIIIPLVLIGKTLK